MSIFSSFKKKDGLKNEEINNDAMNKFFVQAESPGANAALLWIDEERRFFFFALLLDMLPQTNQFADGLLCGSTDQQERGPILTS